jgi:hypothetical protein
VLQPLFSRRPTFSSIGLTLPLSRERRARRRMNSFDLAARRVHRRFSRAAAPISPATTVLLRNALERPLPSRSQKGNRRTPPLGDDRWAFAPDLPGGRAAERRSSPLQASEFEQCPAVIPVQLWITRCLRHLLDHRDRRLPLLLLHERRGASLQFVVQVFQRPNPSTRPTTKDRRPKTKDQRPKTAEGHPYKKKAGPKGPAGDVRLKADTTTRTDRPFGLRRRCRCS